MGVGIGMGLALVAWGAVLAFGVNASPAGVDLNLIGWILMGAGTAGLVIGALAAASRGTAAPEERIVKR